MSREGVFCTEQFVDLSKFNAYPKKANYRALQRIEGCVSRIKHVTTLQELAKGFLNFEKLSELVSDLESEDRQVEVAFVRDWIWRGLESLFSKETKLRAEGFDGFDVVFTYKISVNDFPEYVCKERIVATKTAIEEAYPFTKNHSIFCEGEEYSLVFEIENFEIE